MATGTTQTTTDEVPPSAAVPTASAATSSTPCDGPTAVPVAPEAVVLPATPAADARLTTNELAARFSPTTQASIVKLKSQVPDIVERAGCSTLFGVDLTASNDERIDVLLNKFLVARDGNMEAAAEQLSKTLAWRKSFDVESVPTESFPEDVFGKAGFTVGHAKNGSIVAYTFYGVGDPQKLFSDSRRFVRWRVALMERAVAKLDFRTADQVLLIGDYGGASPTAESKAVAKELSELFSNYYPEMLYRHVFLNVPTWMAWVANLFRAILPIRTFAKFEFVGTSVESHKSAIQAYVALDQLPARYGGTLADDPFVVLD